MLEEQFKRATELINRHSDILLFTHQTPDGDAIGSLLATAIALENLGKRVVPFCADSVPEVFSFLPKIERVENKIGFQSQSVVILLDCQDFKRTGIDEKDFKILSNRFNLKEIDSIVIDHHPEENKGVLQYTSASVNIIEPKMAATTEILFELFENMKVKINKDIATCLLTGLITDTGGFQHSSTDPRVMRIAAILLTKGAHLNKIIRNIFQNKTMPSLKIWGRALERVKIDKTTKAAVSFLNRKDLEECHATLEDLSGVANMLSTIPEARFALFLTEYEPRKISGSLRSEEYKGVDVARLARRLGGGGHKLAAGFEIEGNPEDAFKIVNREILTDI